MPKINLYKPGLETIDFDNLTDTSLYGGLSEIFGVYDTLADSSYKLTYGINNIDDVDFLVLFNSACKDKNILDKIYNLKCKKIQVVTDLNLIYSSNEIGKHKKSSQQPSSKFYFPYQYFYLFFNDMEEFNVDRKYMFGYAGGTRAGNRDIYYNTYLNPSNKFISWIHTSSNVFSTKYKNVFGKIPCNELANKYKKTKYSLVIADPKYNFHNFLTQRPIELLWNGVIPFFDVDYDKLNYMNIPTILRVKDANDIRKKINIFEKSKELKFKIINECEIMRNKIEVDLITWSLSSRLHKIILGDKYEIKKHK